MNDAQHTPGPWGQEHDGSVVMGGQVVFDVTWCAPDGRPEERGPNAALIAAAPELLAALELIADTEGVITVSDGCAWFEDGTFCPVWDIIATATGEKGAQS
jgi:hypothetical protein